MFNLPKPQLLGENKNERQQPQVSEILNELMNQDQTFGIIILQLPATFNLPKSQLYNDT
jgi:hypothetical protein